MKDMILYSALVLQLLLTLLILPYVSTPETSVQEIVQPQWKNQYTNFEKTKECLVKNVFYEGPRYFPTLENRYELSKRELRRNILEDRIKIINVTLNRKEHNRFPDTVCSVIHQYRQFSWTLEQDKVTQSIRNKYKNDPTELQNLVEIEKLVEHALVYGLEDLTDNSIYYHTHAVEPYWNKNKEVVVASMWHVYYNN